MKSILIVVVGALLGAASLLYFLQNDGATPSVDVITQTAPAAGDAVQDAPATAQQADAAPARAQLASAATTSTAATGPQTESPSPPEPTMPEPTAAPPALEQSASAQAPAEPLPAHPGGLLIPVTGIAPTQLQDTFNDRRGSERSHEALDIMAPLKTPVVAVDDGKVVKLFNSVPGGLTVYQYDASGTFAYYYAHLDSYAADLEEGQALKRGDLIGYVGATGNADTLAPHLHFAIFLLGPEKKWWKGTAINPYPLFKR
jgi:murein DD-endopeptidase MepM/ murein hydrolase activator NlpD